MWIAEDVLYLAYFLPPKVENFLFVVDYLLVPMIHFASEGVLKGKKNILYHNFKSKTKNRYFKTKNNRRVVHLPICKNTIDKESIIRTYFREKMFLFISFLCKQFTVTILGLWQTQNFSLSCKWLGKELKFIYYVSDSNSKTPDKANRILPPRRTC